MFCFVFSGHTEPALSAMRARSPNHWPPENSLNSILSFLEAILPSVVDGSLQSCRFFLKIAKLDIFLLVKKRTCARMIQVQMFLWLKHLHNWQFLWNKNVNRNPVSLLWLCCFPPPPPHSLFPLLPLPPYSISLCRPSDHSSGSDFELTLGQGNSVVVRVISCNASTILYPSFRFSNYIAIFTWTPEITLWF